MSKRSQTTGAPKRVSRAPEPTPEEQKGFDPLRPVRQARSRAERDAAIQRLVIVTTLIVGGVVLLLLLIALVLDQLVIPNQAVASVNDETINVAEFQERVRLERAIINNRVNAEIAELSQFVQDPNQVLQFLSQQEPYASWLSEIQVSDQLGNRVLNDMIADELVKMEAAERGITVSEDDIDREMEEFFGSSGIPGLIALEGDDDDEATPETDPTATPTPFVSPTPSPEPTPTAEPTEDPEATDDPEATATVTPFPSATPAPTLSPEEEAEQLQETVDSAVSSISSDAGVSQDFVKEYFEVQALRAALRDEVELDAETTTETANVRHILVETEERAEEIIAALEAGESFADLARALSTDEGSGAQGGELGDASVDGYVPEFADAVREATVGEFVGPVSSQFGFHIIQVRSRGEQDLDPVATDAALDEAFAVYVEGLRDAEGNIVETFSAWADNVPSEPPLRLTGLQGGPTGGQTQ